MDGPQLILDLIEAFRRSKVMFAAARLGVFDLPAGGTESAEALAARLNCCPESFAQLLDACVALGLLEKNAGGAYRNAPVADRYLRRSSPDSLLGYVLYSDSALYPLWGRLEDAVREGGNRWQQVFGGQDNFFANIYGTEAGMREFIAGLHGFGMLSSPAVIAAVDLSPYDKLVDLGGGSGHLAIEACRRYPRMRAGVFDLPPVCRIARETIEAAGMTGRIQVYPGDLFWDQLPPADVYAMGRILHDWDEPRIHKLLGKCFDALPAGGAVLIAERLLAEDKSGPLGATLQSLNMLVATHGRERTASEYEKLLRASGFRTVTARVTGAPLDAVLAVK